MEEFSPLGDSAVRVAFGTEICLTTHRRVLRFCASLQRDPLPYVCEWTPSYTAVTVFYSPFQISYGELCTALAQRKKEQGVLFPVSSKGVRIPVCYALGPDLLEVATMHRLREEEVIAIHSKEEYLVYMLGFVPGFPYLGGMDKRISTPRKKTPRLLVPQGAVGIAGDQTGVYPFATPGGWQIIGQTPLLLYDKRHIQPFLLQAGDSLRFYPISEEEYKVLKKRVENEGYRGDMWKKEEPRCGS